MRKIKSFAPHIISLLLLIAAGLAFTNSGFTLTVGLIIAAIALELLLNREGRCHDFVIWKEEYSMTLTRATRAIPNPE